MRYSADKCPHEGCDSPEVHGEADFVPSCALVRPDGQGGYVYTGETELFHEGQINSAHLLDGKADRVRLQCGNGHEWDALREE